MVDPEPIPPFRWLQLQGRRALVCEALAPLVHFFTTREWPPGSAVDDNDAWTDVALTAGVDPREFVRVRQVHGADTLVVRRGQRPSASDSSSSPLPAADIIVCNDPTMAIAVQTADCAPLLLHDLRVGAVAAVHAGWRGLALGVPAAAIGAMKRSFGTNPADLVAAVGPAIGACCYEVGQEVRDALTGRADDAGTAIGRWCFDTPQPSGRNPALASLVRSARAGHWFLDTWAVTRDQLLQAGVLAANVHVAALCTASHPDAFCSYRRDGRGAGRMAAVIRARERGR